MKALKAKLWYFLNEWTIRKCPYNNRITRDNRFELVKEMFNL